MKGGRKSGETCWLGFYSSQMIHKLIGKAGFKVDKKHPFISYSYIYITLFIQRKWMVISFFRCIYVCTYCFGEYGPSVSLANRFKVETNDICNVNVDVLFKWPSLTLLWQCLPYVHTYYYLISKRVLR
jgi:hypothetical protein